MAQAELTRIRDQILSWEQVIRGDSELYSRLTHVVADDPALLAMLTVVPQGQLHMNMLLAAVQYVMLYDRDVPLAEWYHSLGGKRSPEGVERPFVDFVAGNRDQLLAVMRSRRVQTNEVARCAFLLPAYNVVNALTGRPAALIEVGTSAGLNQNIDRYGYRYESTRGVVELGRGSPVAVRANTGDAVPAPATTMPRIGWRTGMDLHPIDIGDEDQAKWLQALIWPDKVERHTRLAAAIEVAHNYPPTVVGGDVFAVVPTLVEAAPLETAVVIQHSFVLNQFERPARERFYDMLDELASERSIYRVSAEPLEADRGTVLELTIHGPHRSTRELAAVHHHGEWIEWRGV
jgi:hypothetical protein